MTGVLLTDAGWAMVAEEEARGQGAVETDHHAVTASATIIATMATKASGPLDDPRLNDEITRPTLPSPGPALEPAPSNVVKRAKR